jgi:hypothetical protein
MTTPIKYNKYKYYKYLLQKSIKQSNIKQNNNTNKCSFINSITCEYLETHFSKIPRFNHTQIKKIPDRKLIFSVIQVSSYETEPEYAILSEKINQEYCSKHGYLYNHIRIDYKTNDISPYWIRVFELNKLILKLKDNKNIYGFVYIDLDACFCKFDISISQILDYVDSKQKYSMFWGWEYNSWLNSGFGICLNNETTNNILKIWAKYYEDVDGKCWHKTQTTNKWTCFTYDGKNISTIAWDGYEQYRLNLMFTEEQYRKDICPLYQEYLCNPDKKIDSFSYHFYGSKLNAVEVFTNICKNNNISV